MEREGYRLTPMTVGIPTSTPAFQMAAMYGVMPDIPGFHYHDKRRRTDIHFPRAGHAAFVEAEQAGDRRGILADGSVYGCVFTGGAANDYFSFARLTRPRASGLIRVLSAFVVVAWVAAKSAALTVTELVRTAGRIARRPSQRTQEWKLAKKRIAISVWIREWFTCAVARDVYDGVPAIYVNYLDHDETAHALGPRSREAFAALRGVDRSLRQIRRVLRRVPEYGYDLYVLSDHGQASCTPYRVLAGGQPFERVFFDQVLGWAPRRGAGRDGVAPAGEARTSEALQTGARVRALPGRPRVVRAPRDPGGLRRSERLRVLRRRARAPAPGDDRRAIPGSRRCPLEERRGRRWSSPARPPAPSASGAARAIASTSSATAPSRSDRTGRSSRGTWRALMAMRSAGDLVIYGIDAPEGHVSYIDEVGAHAGPSPEELHTFVAAPDGRTASRPGSTIRSSSTTCSCDTSRSERPPLA